METPMNTHARRIGWVVLAVCITAGVGCHDRLGSRSSARSEPPSRGATPSTQPTTLTGTLQGGAVAVGAETTGWRLVGDGATGGIDLDISKVQARAKSLDGKRVTVTGRMSTKNWPERGQTQVLVAESLEPAPSPRK
jgi:hypothetical protein